MRRASWAMPMVINAGSGVPKVGAPEAIDMDAAKVPKITGEPGRIICP